MKIPNTVPTFNSFCSLVLVTILFCFVAHTYTTFKRALTIPIIGAGNSFSEDIFLVFWLPDSIPRVRLIIIHVIKPLRTGLGRCPKQPSCYTCSNCDKQHHSSDLQIRVPAWSDKISRMCTLKDIWSGGFLT